VAEQHESDIDLAMRQEQQAESLLESAIIRALKQEEMAREIITRVLPALSGKSLDKVLIAVLNVLRTR
jgi:hypothetical protein